MIIRVFNILMRLSGQEGGLFVVAEGVITVFICYPVLYKPAGFDKDTTFLCFML